MSQSDLRADARCDHLVALHPPFIAHKILTEAAERDYRSEAAYLRLALRDRLLRDGILIDAAMDEEAA
jgi:hypothetical protein